VVTVHSLWSGLGPVPAAAAQLAGLRTAPVSWTAVSTVAARELTRRLPRGTRVDVLPNAVDVATRPRPVRSPHEAVRLVSTMRIARRKRPLALLRMFEQVARGCDVAVELTIVGDGPMRPVLERAVRRARLTGLVALTGRLEPAEVLDRVARADVYVAPAILESFGLAALEARSLGLPVVGRADSGLTDFVTHGAEGLLCASDADMVDRLRELLMDPSQRHRIGEHNRTVPSTMTWARTLDEHDRVYAAARGTTPYAVLTPLGGR
jgi:glycosyltransferase involved in cell wall biosynthesis